jgi:hypothetical protein
MQAKRAPRHSGNIRPHLAPENIGYYGIARLLDILHSTDLSLADLWLCGYIKATLEDPSSSRISMKQRASSASCESNSSEHFFRVFNE